MTRLLALVALLGLAAAATGCTMAHTQVVRHTETEANDQLAPGETAHVYANSWGVYLFALPIFTGAHVGGGEGDGTFFRDTVVVATVAEMVRAQARAIGATHLLDLQTHYLSEWSSGFILFWLREVEASGNAIRVPEGTAPPPGAVPVGG